MVGHVARMVGGQSIKGENKQMGGQRQRVERKKKRREEEVVNRRGRKKSPGMS